MFEARRIDDHMLAERAAERDAKLAGVEGCGDGRHAAMRKRARARSLRSKPLQRSLRARRARARARRVARKVANSQTLVSQCRSRAATHFHRSMMKSSRYFYDGDSRDRDAGDDDNDDDGDGGGGAAAMVAAAATTAATTSEAHGGARKKRGAAKRHDNKAARARTHTSVARRLRVCSSKRAQAEAA